MTISLKFRFQTRRFLWEFPIGSYVKLNSAVAAILVGGLKCRTQFWKGTTQGSFQQSLAEISWVVSEKKIFLNFILLFLFLAWWPSWLEVGITGHNFQGLPKDHSTKVWLQLAQWFLRRILKCEMLRDGSRMKSDGNSSLGLKARWASNGIYVKLLLAMQLQLKFELILTYTKAAMDNWRSFLFLATAAILNGGRMCLTQFWKGPTQGPSLPGLV
jgi:hypothetical protein